MKDNHILQGGESRNTSTSQKSRASPPRRILVVDDDNSIRQLSTEALIQSGYEVGTAEDGDAAWQALHTGSYDLLTTDHHMPKVTGIGRTSHTVIATP